jgi:hypothetical protein
MNQKIFKRKVHTGYKKFKIGNIKGSRKTVIDNINNMFDELEKEGFYDITARISWSKMGSSICFNYFRRENDREYKDRLKGEACSGIGQLDIDDIKDILTSFTKEKDNG